MEKTIRSSVLLCIFGLSGVGKSYFASLLSKKMGFYHLEGDLLLTEEIKACLQDKKTWTEAVHHEFVKHIVYHIVTLKETSTRPIVLSQGLYRQKNRLFLAKSFPEMEFIHLTARPKIIRERLRLRKGLSVSYASELERFLEPMPGSWVIENNQEGEAHLILQMQKKLERP